MPKENSTVNMPISKKHAEILSEWCHEMWLNRGDNSDEWEEAFKELMVQLDKAAKG